MYTDKNRKSDFKYFIKNYDRLYSLYGVSVLAIRNKHVLGSFNSEVEALNVIGAHYPIGDFIVQRCDGTESAYTDFISSWGLLW